MKQLGRPVCPYCGKKVNFVVAWGLRRRGEYSCPRCHGISNVFLSGVATVAAFFAIFISVILLLCLIFLLQEATWWSILVVLAPYVVFYVLSLFCVQLRKPVFRRASGSGKPSSSPRPAQGTPKEKREENLGDTRIL